MDGTDPATPLRGRHNAVALAAVRLAPARILGRFAAIHDRQLRCDRPRPGGATRKADAWVQLDDGTDVSLVKHRASLGGDIEIVLGLGSHVTLVGDRLRILRRDLPETLVAASAGRRVGEIVALRGHLSALADARVLQAEEDHGFPLLTLDLPDAAITRGDLCRDALARPAQPGLI